MYKHAFPLVQLSILPIMPSIEEIVYDCIKTQCKDQLFESVRNLRERYPHKDLTQVYIESYNKIKNG